MHKIEKRTGQIEIHKEQGRDRRTYKNKGFYHCGNAGYRRSKDSAMVVVDEGWCAVEER
ncbi:hypothetical protein U1Q18_025705, partial [Sarracenia purpurea var. burkii]